MVGRVTASKPSSEVNQTAQGGRREWTQSFQVELSFSFEVAGRSYTGTDSRFTDEAGYYATIVGQGRRVDAKSPALSRPGDPVEVVFDPVRPEYNRAAGQVEHSPEWSPWGWVTWLLWALLPAVIGAFFGLLALAPFLGSRLGGQAPKETRG